MKTILLQIAVFLISTISLFLMRHLILTVGKKDPRRKHARRSKGSSRGKLSAINPAQVSSRADSRAAPKRENQVAAASSRIDRRLIF
jgi:hypothetical protein